MSAQAQNHTLDDFLTPTTCAGCGDDFDDGWIVPSDTPLGRVIEVDCEEVVCDECFKSHSDLYCVGGDGQ